MNKYSIRTATKAIIIEDGKILLNKYSGRNIYYTLPGGGQDHNEDLKSNLKRECLEEIGAEVQVGEVLFVREFIADNHNPSKNRQGYHQVNIIFECSLLSRDFKKPTQPDPNQTGYIWVEIDKLLDYNLYPLSLRDHIISFNKQGRESIYLGETD